MKITIKNRFYNSIIYEHDCEENNIKKTVEQAVKEKINLRYADLRNANLSGADLQKADLRYADLRYADLQKANLQKANLCYADLSHANLSEANLQKANLCYADLSHANLRYVNLSDADLSHADLSHADLDYSCFPLWCGSFNITCDERLVDQLLFHVTKLNYNNPEFIKLKEALKPFAEKFHRFNECKDK